MSVRTLIQDFQLGNPLYIGATVTFYTVSAGVKTTTKATLYSALTGTATLANPQTLDSDGKLQQPVYADVAVVATVSGLTVADHDTGVMQPLEEGAVFLIENMAIEYANAATVARVAAELAETNAETAETNAETAESNANDAAGRAEVDAALAMGNAALATASNVVRKAGDTMTGNLTMSDASVIDANASVAAHATTMDPWSLGNYVPLTGAAVTFTALTAAPQAGAEVELYMNAAHVFTDGAVFEVDGNANYTATIGDRVLMRAKSTTVFTVHPRKSDGTAVIASATGGRLLDVTVFTASGTWTKPAGTAAIEVFNQAPGAAAGGAAPAATSRSGGGGAGEFFYEYITTGIGATETVTIGAAGAAPAAGDNPGGDAGNSTFGAHHTAIGGKGGAGSGSQSGGLGGTGGTGGTVHSQGGGGHHASANRGGEGGDAHMGGGGLTNQGAAGAAGGNYGGGGGGSESTGTALSGGAGGPGLMIVKSYS